MDLKEILYLTAALVTILAGISAVVGLLIRHGVAKFLKPLALFLVLVTCVAVLAFLWLSWPKALLLELTASDAPKTITNSIGMKLVPIQPGKFLMGSPPEERDRQVDEYQHEVEITQPFYIGVFEVTQNEYEKVMGPQPFA